VAVTEETRNIRHGNEGVAGQVIYRIPRRSTSSFGQSRQLLPQVAVVRGLSGLTDREHSGRLATHAVFILLDQGIDGQKVRLLLEIRNEGQFVLHLCRYLRRDPRAEASARANVGLLPQVVGGRNAARHPLVGVSLNTVKKPYYDEVCANRTVISNATHDRPVFPRRRHDVSRARANLPRRAR